MSAWRNNLVRRPLSLYEWLATATNRPPTSCFLSTNCPGNRKLTRPCPSFNRILIFRLVFHCDDEIVRKCRTMRLHRDGFDHFWKATRINALYNVVSFKRVEQSRKRTRVTMLLSVSILQIRNYYLNIFKGIECIHCDKLLETNFWIDYTFEEEEKLYYCDIINILIQRDALIINHSIFCINKKKNYSR